MTGWLVGIGVPVAGFLALIGSVWHHRGRHTGRHVAPTGTLARDVYDATVPVRRTEHGPPWEDAPEPDATWVADLRAALEEVEPSGWVKPELGHIMAAPTLAGELDLMAAVSTSPQTAELAHVIPEPTRLADTTDQLRLDLAMDVAGYMVEQDADATRYGEDLAGWCAGQLRALRETLCLGR